MVTATAPSAASLHSACVTLMGCVAHATAIIIKLLLWLLLLLGAKSRPKDAIDQAMLLFAQLSKRDQFTMHEEID